MVIAVAVNGASSKALLTSLKNHLTKLLSNKVKSNQITNLPIKMKRKKNMIATPFIHIIFNGIFVVWASFNFLPFMKLIWWHCKSVCHENWLSFFFSTFTFHCSLVPIINAIALRLHQCSKIHQKISYSMLVYLIKVYCLCNQCITVPINLQKKTQNVSKDRECMAFGMDGQKQNITLFR